MKKNVLVINGNPATGSYCSALCGAYEQGATESGATVDKINIADLKFNVGFPSGRRDDAVLEPDIQSSIEKILWADHLAWVHPLWWYGYPAIMKGFIDRVLLPDVAFKFTGAAFPEKLLSGKSARIVTTADTPGFYYRWFMGKPAEKQLKKGTLQFCGVSPVRTTYIAPIRNSTPEFREAWLSKVKRFGERII